MSSVIFHLGGSYFPIVSGISGKFFLYRLLGSGKTWLAVGYAAFTALDRDPSVYQILLS